LKPCSKEHRCYGRTAAATAKTVAQWDFVILCYTFDEDAVLLDLLNCKPVMNTRLRKIENRKTADRFIHRLADTWMKG
jgi:hypothetical protein